MAGEWKALRVRLSAATILHARCIDPDEKHLLGADVRELERLVEIAAASDPEVPR